MFDFYNEIFLRVVQVVTNDGAVVFFAMIFIFTKNQKNDFVSMCCTQGRRQRGSSGARPPHLKSVPPYFTFGPLVAPYIQYSVLKMWPPLLVFGPSIWFLTNSAAKSWRRTWLHSSQSMIIRVTSS